MGNCIISKLGGSVNNDELLKLGDVKINVQSMKDSGYATSAKAHNIWFQFNSLDGEPYMEIIGDGYFTDSTLSQNLGKTLIFSTTAYTGYYVSDGDYTLIIHSQYQLRKIAYTGESNMYSAFILDCDTIRRKLKGAQATISVYSTTAITGNMKNVLENEIEYLTWYRDTVGVLKLGWLAESVCKETLAQFNVSGATHLTGKISDFNVLTNIKVISINLNATLKDPETNTITGDLADLNPSNPSLVTNISFRACSLITGDISALGKFYNLTSMQVDSSPNLTGTLETFLDAVHSNGRNSGTMTIRIGGTGITYNGASTTSVLTATFTASGWSVA